MLALKNKVNLDYIVSSCWGLTWYLFLEKVLTIWLIFFLSKTWTQPVFLPYQYSCCLLTEGWPGWVGLGIVVKCRDDISKNATKLLKSYVKSVVSEVCSCVLLSITDIATLTHKSSHVWLVKLVQAFNMATSGSVIAKPDDMMWFTG